MSRGFNAKRALAKGLVGLMLVLAFACRMPTRVTIELQPSGGSAARAQATQPTSVPKTPSTAAPTRAASPTATAAPLTATASATPSPSPTVTHTMYPGEPVYAQRLWDATCGQIDLTRPPIVPPSGDDYFVNLYERPFNAETQDQYFPELDIRRADIGTDGTWVYVSLQLYSLPDAGQPQDVTYGVELDLDIDGRGEWLILAQAPLSSDWQVSGVQVYYDSDEDVGEARACRADPPQDGTSYDTLVFDAGQGQDPDAAWARWVLRSRPEVQLAIKYDLIQRDPAFMWWVWADRGVRQAGWMDYHDHFQPDEAGSPFPANRYFPARQVALVDNTCHWVFGFEPTGNEPCICEGDFPTPTPTSTPTPEQTTPPPRNTRLVGRFFKDRDGDGAYDPNEAVSGIQVVVWRGGCGSPGPVVDSAVSGSDGAYTLEVPPGQWCIVPERNNFWTPSYYSVETQGQAQMGPFDFQYTP